MCTNQMNLFTDPCNVLIVCDTSYTQSPVQSAMSCTHLAVHLHHNSRTARCCF